MKFPAIIPLPVEMTIHEEKFVINADTQIYYQINLKEQAEYFNMFFQSATNLLLEMVEAESPPDQSVPGMFLGIIDKESSQIPFEGYSLQITTFNIQIEGSDVAGVFYGIQTLRQLLPSVIESPVPKSDISWAVPCLNIRDYPRFHWRGFMLDECRHFFGKKMAKRMIDLIALFKFNKLHWHLTEDEGWRIESKRFPKLHTIASKRLISKKWQEEPNMDDPRWYGGYYTQEDIREIIEYARIRCIEVFPEIEMPGHATAPLVAYPEFSCATPPELVPTIGWGNRHAFCAGNPETYKFLEQVLDEIIEIFPSDKIHIGGDELPTERWKACSKCQSFMKQAGIADLDQLQVYFAAQIIKYLSIHDRTTIGWFDFPVDRLLCQGIDPTKSDLSILGGLNQEINQFR